MTALCVEGIFSKWGEAPQSSEDTEPKLELVESALMDSGITLSSDLHIGFVASSETSVGR